MKKIVFLIAILFTLVSFSFPSKAGSSTSLNSYITSLTEVIYIEYVEIGDQWFKITYYSDGSIQIQAVATNEP